MCGIGGFSGDFPESLLEFMNQSMAYRGPDDSGSFYSNAYSLGLCHRRLSIIDASSFGHQPMFDPSNKVAIVFNGEIYNFRELRV